MADYKEEEFSILIVDDIPKNIQILGKILQKAKYKISFATDGKKALSMVDHVKPDLILLDIMMPDFDGYETCEALKKMPSTKDIPVIFITAKVESKDIIKGFEVGAVDYITKPFNAIELLSRVKVHLRLKHNENALIKAKDEAEKANQAKTEFLARMSHEIRTPMNAILSMASLLWESPLNEYQKKYVHTFKIAGENLLSIINDILDLSKIEAGQLELEQIYFDLKQLIKELYDIISIKTKEKKIQLNIYFEEKVPHKLIGDPVRLRQILLNLLSNAVKFTHEGEISIYVKLFDGEESTSNKDITGILFMIKDTGIGIPFDMQKKIFEAFTQVDSSTTRKFGGTGLGLNICRKFIEMMGGKIWVDSKTGSGSSFYFTAFFKQFNTEILQPLKTIDHLDEITNDLKKLTKQLHILLVEDSEANRFVIQAYLKDFPFIIDCAENGQICIEKFICGHYDMILMDIQMPVMDGYTAASEIRKFEIDKRLNPTAIIAITASTMKNEREKCFDSGCNDYLAKPLSKGCLIEKIHKFSKNSRKDEKIFVNADPIIADKIPWYIEKLHDYLNNLKTALDNEDYKAIASFGHKMKGSGNSYGFEKITQLGLSIEQNGKNKDLNMIKKLICDFDYYLKNIVVIYP